jgi:hypothetical protein
MTTEIGDCGEDASAAGKLEAHAFIRLDHSRTAQRNHRALANIEVDQPCLAARDAPPGAPSMSTQLVRREQHRIICGGKASLRPEHIHVKFRVQLPGNASRDDDFSVSLGIDLTWP